MDASPAVEALQNEYLRLADALLAGTDGQEVAPMRDRDIFDLLGFQ